MRIELLAHLVDGRTESTRHDLCTEADAHHRPFRRMKGAHQPPRFLDEGMTVVLINAHDAAKDHEPVETVGRRRHVAGLAGRKVARFRRMDQRCFCARPPGFIEQHAGPGVERVDQIENMHGPRQPLVEAKRSLALTITSTIPGSVAVCPASGTMLSSTPGQAFDSSQAVNIGVTTS